MKVEPITIPAGSFSPKGADAQTGIRDGGAGAKLSAIPLPAACFMDNAELESTTLQQKLERVDLEAGDTYSEGVREGKCKESAPAAAEFNPERMPQWYGVSASQQWPSDKRASIKRVGCCFVLLAPFWIGIIVGAVLMSIGTKPIEAESPHVREANIYKGGLITLVIAGFFFCQFFCPFMYAGCMNVFTGRDFDEALDEIYEACVSAGGGGGGDIGGGDGGGGE